jgi:hypothetical protein
MCAIQIVTKTANLILLNICRAPSGDTYEFLKRLDAILKYLYSTKSEFIFCSYINVNYLNENNCKQKINSLLKTYNTYPAVNFAASVQNSSSKAIDNIL